MSLGSLITMDEFTIQETRKFPQATGELSSLLRDLGLAGKIINKQVRKAGLADLLGKHGATNVQGEEQMKLDVFAIDVNASIGTIFSIYRRVSPLGQPCTEEDFLQPGNKLMAAGYIIYGSSTMMVYATKISVNGFTLEPSIGEFCLSHPNMKVPVDGKIYSLNQGNTIKYSEGMKQYLNYCMESNKEEGRPYGHRYIGSMVADLHRTLIKGGIFIYPADKSNANGKLRLQYECNPMTFIVEAAGGKGSSGSGNILDIVPTELHQRTPIFIGSKNMVNKAVEFVKEKEVVS